MGKPLEVSTVLCPTSAHVALLLQPNAAVSLGTCQACANMQQANNIPFKCGPGEQMVSTIMF